MMDSQMSGVTFGSDPLSSLRETDLLEIQIQMVDNLNEYLFGIPLVETNLDYQCP